MEIYMQLTRALKDPFSIARSFNVILRSYRVGHWEPHGFASGTLAVDKFARAPLVYATVNVLEASRIVEQHLPRNSALEALSALEDIGTPVIFSEITRADEAAVCKYLAKLHSLDFTGLGWDTPADADGLRGELENLVECWNLPR